MDDKPSETDQTQAFDVRDEETFSRPNDQATSASSVQEPMKIKKESSAKKWLLSGLVLVLLSGAGAFGYWQWTESENLRSELSSVQSERDTLKKAAQVGQDDEEEKPEATTLTDSDMVKTETEAYIAAFKDAKYVVQASGVKVSGNFAVVTAVIPNSDAEGMTVVLEKSKNDWVVLYGATGEMTAAEKTKLVDVFGVPASLLQ